MEASVGRKLGGGSGDNVGAGAAAEIDTEVKSRMMKERSKRRIQDDASPKYGI